MEKWPKVLSRSITASAQLAKISKIDKRNIAKVIRQYPMQINPYYFSAFFKKQTGENFKEFLLKVRMEKALAILLSSDCKTYEIAAQVGFNDPKHFSDMFKKYYGKNPMDYKKALL